MNVNSDITVPHLDIILPIGISFYTFHTISYIVDSYRGVIKPTRNFFEFAAYVSLFSQLVAGPIVRFRQIEQDLENLGHADRTRWLLRGISFFIVGLMEKVVMADSLAAFVDPALANYQALSTGGAWLAVLGYTFQLYFDFSGYSTMAVGLGYMFGLRIPQNFNSPYKALDPADFWRRWHISLSTCMRDYLYIPFGGNRGSTAETYRNLMLTMLIGGLWHGAAGPSFSGGSTMACSCRSTAPPPGTGTDCQDSSGSWQCSSLAVIGWVFFRSTSFEMALRLLRKMFTPSPGVLIPQLPLVLLAIAIAALWSHARAKCLRAQARLALARSACARVGIRHCARADRGQPALALPVLPVLRERSCQ